MFLRRANGNDRDKFVAGRDRCPVVARFGSKVELPKLTGLGPPLADHSETIEFRRKISLFLIELCDLALPVPKLDGMAVRELLCNADSLFVVVAQNADTVLYLAVLADDANVITRQRIIPELQRRNYSRFGDRLLQCEI